MPAIARCTAQRYGGAFCDATTIEGSPFPICFHHAMQVHRYFTDAVRVAAPTPDPVEPFSGEVVYYVEWGNGRVKIGYTASLVDRMMALAIPPDQVLAVEPGSKALEQARHRQFDSDRVATRREVFHLSRALTDHIRTVKSDHPDLIVRTMGVST